MEKMVMKRRVVVETTTTGNIGTQEEE